MSYNEYMTLAQATGAPYSGASNAEDFQPPTRNPQNEAIPTQPQDNNLQNPSSLDVLNNQNARIVVQDANGSVASSQTDTQDLTVAKSGAIDLIWVVVLVLLVLYIILFVAHNFRHKKDNASSEKTNPAEAKTQPPAEHSRPKTKKKKKPGHRRKRK